MLAPRPTVPTPDIGTVAPEGIVELIAAVTGVLAAQLVARLDLDESEPVEPDEASRPNNTFLGRSRRGRPR